MALFEFEFNVPDEEGWEDSLASRIIFVLLGLLMFRMGFRIWGGLMPEYTIGAVATLCLFAIGTQLLIFAAMDPEHLDLDRWGRWIAYAILGAIFIFGTIALHYLWIDKIGTDALLFSQVAVSEFVSHGTNPFTIDMAPHVRSWKGPQYATPRINGDIVRQLSYPAGAMWWFVPQYATVGETQFGIRLTLWLLAFVGGVLAIEAFEPRLAIAGVAIFMATRNMFVAAAGGVIWPIWVVPLIAGLLCWARERWLLAAACIGLGAASKQHAWVVLPFLAIWQYKITRTPRAFARRAGKMIAVGGVVFLLLNGPFILANPVEWVDGVLTPLNTKAPMVHQGMGLAVLPFVGALALPAWWFSLTVAAAALTSMTAYWLYFERLKWVAWVIAPPILFFHTRSLMSYFTTWAPLGALAAAAAWGRLNHSIPRLRAEPDRSPTGVVADD